MKILLISLILATTVAINGEDPDEIECEVWTCAATSCVEVPTPCPCGTILVSGRGLCGCCSQCVTPKIGDDCYQDGNNNGTLTCGPDLRCCKNGKCGRNCRRHQ